MTKIVVISGKQGSGKSTIASALMKRAKELEFDFVGVMKFADTLYELHDYLLNKMSDLTGQPRPEKLGPLLQYLGTEFGRVNYGENVWVDIMKNKVNKYLPNSSNTRRLVIIDDCRFENEFDAFPEALRVRLSCSEDERKSRTQSWREFTQHPSETGLDSYSMKGMFDLTFNTSTETQTSVLVSNVEHIVSMIMSTLMRGTWAEKRV